MDRFIIFKVGLAIGLIGLLLSYFIGNERGKNEAIKQNETEIIKSVEVAKQVEQDNAGLSDSDLRQRLRENDANK